MFNRTTMFVVLALSACLFTSPAPAQCIQNADGTITCPVLAPPLPPAVAAEAKESSTAEPVGADRLTLRERRKMGFTRLNVILATRRLAARGELPSTRGLTGDDLAAARAEIKDAIAFEILGDNIQAWNETVGDGNDWGAFFEQLLAFLERLMPLILQLFGGLALDATLTPTTSVADCVPVVGPPVMLAA